MALEKIRKKTIFQRLRNLVLGKEKPNLLTRVSVISGFIVWIYLFTWQLLTTASILLLGNLEQSPIVRAAYVHLGHKEYGLMDTINRLFFHSLFQITICLVILVGLVLIWRQKKLGFVLYVGGNLITLFVSFAMMGWAFMVREIPVLDYILILGSTIYFAIGLFVFHRNKGEELQLSDH